jgi:hypothetical protein
MDAAEIQAKATIAAALIVSRAVEVPRVPGTAQAAHDDSAMRLRDLTEYVYRILTTAKS